MVSGVGPTSSCALALGVETVQRLPFHPFPFLGEECLWVTQMRMISSSCKGRGRKGEKSLEGRVGNRKTWLQPSFCH